MTDQSFAIDVTALQDDLYRITAQTQTGEWRADTIPRIDKAELRDCLSLLSRGNPVLTNAEAGEQIRLFGQKLFDFLIGNHGEILTAYRSALEKAGNQRLFVRLSTEKAGRFITIPWEYLNDPENGFLALSRQIPLIRCQPDLTSRPPAPVIYPFKALVVTASPPNYSPRR